MVVPFAETSVSTRRSTTCGRAQSTALPCPGNTIIDGIAGDPAMACSIKWQRWNGGTAAPAMTAYDNDLGVSVLFAADSVPDGSM